MKHFYLFIFLILLSFSSFAQNTFPTAANSSVGIGTTTPTSPLDVNGATRLRLAVEMSNNQFFAFNAYNNATAPAGWKYRVAGFASSFVQNAAGTFTFNLGNSTSGAINTAVTWRPVYTILNSGNIGIGSITPDSRLDVVGNLAGKSNFRALGTAAKLTIDNNATGQNLYDAGLHLFRDNSGVERVRIDGATGRIGLGLSSAPLALLHLGGASNKGLRINTVLNNAAFLGGWQDQAVLSVNRNAWDGTFTDATKAAASIQLEGLTTGSNIQFLTSPTINTLQLERMRIIANGNVGIGTTTPTAKLEVNSGLANNSGLKFTNLNSASTPVTANGKALSVNATGEVIMVNAATGGGGVAIDSVVRKNINFENGPGSFGTAQKMSILNNGNVGIGVNTTTFKLDAKGSEFYFGSHENTTTNTQVSISSGVNANSWLNFGQYNTFDGIIWRIGRSGSDQSFRISNWGSGAEVNALTAVSNGNVGIGTATPGSKLEVNSGTSGVSGLKFTNLNSANVGLAGNNKALSVDNNGNVILVNVGSSISIVDTTFKVINGSVGLGTTIPQSLFHVKGGSTMSAGWNKTATLEGTYPVLTFNGNNNKWSGIGYDFSTAMRFWVNASNTDLPSTGFNPLTLSNNGNVGIGIGAPTNTLDVNGHTRFRGLLEMPTNTDFVWNAYYAAGAWKYRSNGFAGGFYQDPNGGLAYNLAPTGVADAALTFNRAFTVINNGNFGIGTSSPTSKLEVNSGTAGLSGLKFTSLNSASTSIASNGKALSVDSDGKVILVNAVSSTLNTNLDSIYVKKIYTNFGNTNVGLKIEEGNASPNTGFLRFGDGTGWKMHIGRRKENATTAVQNTSDVGSIVTFDDRGRVGIGSTTPTEKLEIAAAGNVGIRLFNTLANTWDIKNTENGYLDFIRGGNNLHMRIDQYGNMGVGTASPASLLSVLKNQSSATSISVSNSGPVSPTTMMQFLLSEDGSSTHGYFRRYRDGTGLTELGFTNDLAFSTGVAATKSEKMRILTNGNVGIGIVSPVYKLDVNGHLNLSAASNIYIGGKLALYKSAQYQYLADADGRTAIALGGTTDNTNYYNNYNHYFSNVAGTVTNMALVGGNLGIGTTTPSQKLEINSGVAGVSGLKFSNLNQASTPVAANGKALSVNTAGDVVLVNVASASSTAIDSTVRRNISFENGLGSFGTAQKMSIMSSGNVGIGTINPTQKLEVNGSILVVNGNAHLETVKNQLLFGFNGTPTYMHGIKTRHHSDLASGNAIDFYLWKKGVDPLGTPGTQHALTLNGEGSVGIGTTNPTQKLEIGGGRPITFNSSLGAIKMKADPGGWAMNYGFTGSSNTDLGGFFGYGNLDGINYWSIGKQYTDNFLVVHHGGNVGLGTISPNKKLHVVGETRLDGNLYVAGPGDATSFLSFFADRDNNNPYFSGFKYNNNSGWTEWRGTNNAIRINEAGFFDIRKGANSADNTVTQNLLRIQATNGFVGIGTESPRAKLDVNGTVAIGFEGALAYPVGYKLAVDGNIIAEKVKVKNSLAWPDFVFKKDYKLPSLEEIEKYVNENSHLPEMPSASEIEKDGQDLGEMNRLLLKKVEELTLYIIEQNKDIKSLKDQNTKLESLESELAKIKAVLKIKD